MDIIEQLKQSGLLGRSGSNFPVFKKWEAVLRAPSDKKFVICNGAEGEPNVFKDEFILNNYLNEVVNGLKIALQTIKPSSGYIYLNKNLYQKHKNKLQQLIENNPIELFEKPSGPARNASPARQPDGSHGGGHSDAGGYLAGEETSLLNAIEGKRPAPRQKPPFPTQTGLWKNPTLIHNVETFYWVSKINQGQYQNKRFYCIEGDIANKGVFELSETLTIEQILKETKNYPNFPFFCQVGGGAVGEILLSKEINKPVKGLASIIIFNKEKTNPMDLLKKWANFLNQENCDKCAPCREGLFRIKEIIEQSNQEISIANRQALNDIFAVLQKTSFCPLGRSAYIPFQSAIEKLF